MRYCVATCNNGNFIILSEHGEDLNSARMSWHAYCRTYINTPEVLDATVSIVDSNLDRVKNFTEVIHHDPPKVEPTPVVEPTEPTEE